MTPSPTRALGEIAEFVRGVTFKPSDVVNADPPETIRCMRTKNVQRDLDLRDVWNIDRSIVKRNNQILQEGDLLISSANSWNLVGKCSWVPQLEQASTFGGFVTALKPNRKAVDPRYLYYFFSSAQTQAEVRSFARQTTNIANLDLERCRQLEVPLPCLPEQRRIAAILDQAEAIRADRSSVNNVTAMLPSIIFQQMFGDPTSKSPTWPLAPLSSLLSTIESGTSPVCQSRVASVGEYGVLKLGAVTSGEYRPDQNKFLAEQDVPENHLEVQANDVLFTRKNTRELVGAAAYVQSTPEKLLLPDLIFRLRIRDSNQLDPRFLQATLMHPRMRKIIQGMAGGSAGSMPNISKARLMCHQLPVPPISLQRQFSLRAEHIARMSILGNAALDELHALFASLQSRAFRGEL